MTWEKKAPPAVAARGEGFGKPAKRLNDSTFSRPRATAIDAATFPAVVLYRDATAAARIGAARDLCMEVRHG